MHMDSGIKVHYVAGLVLERREQPPRLVDLHLTAHHTILVHGATGEETRIPHSLLLSVHLRPRSSVHASRTPLVLRGRDFEVYTVLFSKKADARAIYDSLEAVVACRNSTQQLYAFGDERARSADAGSQLYDPYDPQREFARMGVFPGPQSLARTSAWRSTSVNASYDYCPTYPATLVVPSKISDTTLNYGKAYRSKFRIPGLVYLHWANLGTITRSSQPMVGLKGNRSIQDEKLIEAIFTSHSQHHTSVKSENMADASYIAHGYTVYGATSSNLIIDARPTTNAMANVAKGAGTENMEYYRNCKKAYLGIDNIHVMRDSLTKVYEATQQMDKINYDLLRRSNWLKHLSAILEGIVIIVKAVHLANSHVLVHCSDGWDRTSQLSSLSQLCLDPYYRTLEGFAVLVEKDWVSYGHRFADRLGHTAPSRVQFLNTSLDEDSRPEDDLGFLASFQHRLNFTASSHIRETCPVFDQFLDCVHQLLQQFPESFQFNETFLLHLQKYLYECKHGTFLWNSEKDKREAEATFQMPSVWSDLLDVRHRSTFTNSQYSTQDQEVLFPNPKQVRWWLAWLKRPELNQDEASVALPGQLDSTSPTIVDDQAHDPVLKPVLGAPDANADPEQLRSGDGLDLPSEPFQRSASPGIAGGRTLQSVLDTPAVSSASTAVQGAMRSAWSAWKTVKSGYENTTREMKPRSDRESQPATNVSSSNATLSTESLTKQDLSPQSPAPMPKIEHGAKHDTHVMRDGWTIDNTGPEMISSPVEQVDRPVTGPEKSDPLGVSVW